MRRSLCVVTYLAEAALVSLVCLRAHGQPSAADPAQLLAAARPHLEAVLGTQLEKLPQLVAATAAEVCRLPDPGLDVALLARFPDLRGADFERARQAARQAKASATVARQAPGSDVIYLLPQQQANIARWDESLHFAGSPAFLQLAVVHEVVRGVLDRRYDLARRRGSCRDAEESLILEAIVEGRAQWVTRQVARRLGTEACFPPLAECRRRVPDVTPDPGLRAMSQTALRQEHWACVQGLEFFSYLEEQGGSGVEGRVFRRPPRQLRWLESPRLYVRSEQQNLPELAAVLARVQQGYTPAGWHAAQQPWTPAMVGQAAALFGARDRAEAVLKTWDEGRSLLWVAADRSARQIALSVVRHETAAGARSYYGLAVDLQRKQDALSGGETGLAMQVLDSRSAAVALPGVEEAVRTDKKIQFGGTAQPARVSTLLARSGDLVIEFSWYGLEPDAAWAERVVGAVLAAAASK